MNALLKKLLAGSALALAATTASATTATDTTFDDITTTLRDWAEGSLGKTISLAMLIVGISAGIVRQSVIAAVAGIAGALVMAYGPGVMISIFAYTV